PVTLTPGTTHIRADLCGAITPAHLHVERPHGGATWTPAKLQDPVLPKAHTRFRHLWHWTGGDAVIMSRAVDETGYVQPTRDALIASRGVSTVGYHTNPITGWQVRADGAVTFRPEPWT